MNSRAVLIVDSDADLVGRLIGPLAERGYELLVAHTVAATAGVLDGKTPQVAVVARSLPDGDGGLVRDLLAARGLDVKVVDLVEGEIAARESGLPGPTALTLAKPVAVDELIAAIERLASAGAGGRDSRARSRPATRVLVIDDEVDHCDMIEECLSRGGREQIEVICAHSVAEACAILGHDSFDFVLLDHNLPDGTGCDVMERMEEQLLTTPVIGLSTSGDPQVALADFRRGAIEFIQKHEAFEGDLLRKRVFDAIANHKRRIMANVMEQRRRHHGIEQTNEELIAAARTDAMLQIFNRAAFDDVHGDLHASSQASRKAYGLCLVDVDNFKRFNDHYGHAAGDDVLRKIARALGDTLRPEDFLARYGGEELVTLLEVEDEVALSRATERLCKAVWKLDIPHEHNCGHGRVTVSCGATLCRPGSDATSQQVIERADAALYRAKSGGRNAALIEAEHRADRDAA